MNNITFNLFVYVYRLFSTHTCNWITMRFRGPQSKNGAQELQFMSFWRRRRKRSVTLESFGKNICLSERLWNWSLLVDRAKFDSWPRVIYSLYIWLFMSSKLESIKYAIAWIVPIKDASRMISISLIPWNKQLSLLSTSSFSHCNRVDRYDIAHRRVCGRHDKLREVEVRGTSTLPATELLFIVNDEGPMLDLLRRAEFHSRVSKFFPFHSKIPYPNMSERPQYELIFHCICPLIYPNLSEWYSYNMYMWILSHPH